MSEESQSSRLHHQKHVLEALLSATSLPGAPGEDLIALLLKETQAAGFDRVRLYLLSESQNILVSRAQVGMKENFTERVWSIPDDPYLATLLASPFPQLFQRETHNGFVDLTHGDDVDECACVGIQHQGELLGVISADNKFSRQPIGADLLHSLAYFAPQFAVTMKSHLLGSMERRARNLQAILDTSQQLVRPSISIKYLISLASPQ
jgi:hypothetical protein